jgi:hypothetical protein
MRGGVRLTLSIDGAEAHAIDVPAEARGIVEEATIDTSAWAGRDVTLEIEVRGRRSGETGVAIDGVFEPPPRG